MSWIRKPRFRKVKNIKQREILVSLLSTDPNSGIPSYNDPKSLACISAFQLLSLPLPLV